MSPESAKCLGSGLSKTSSLGSFTINRCGITPFLMYGIAEGIAESQFITHLDFSYNGIEDEAALILLQAILKNNEKKDDKTWKKSLRKRKMSLAEMQSSSSLKLPRKDIKGITVLNLKSNFIGLSFMRQFSKSIQFDMYIRVVNLSDNLLDTSCTHLLLDAVNSNCTLVNFDITNNACYTDKLKSRIAIKLLKNYRDNMNEGYKNEQMYISRQQL